MDIIEELPVYPGVVPEINIPSSMTKFTSTVGEFFSTCIDWLCDVLNVVSDSPALTVFVFAIPLVGFSVYLFKLLLSL